MALQVVTHADETLAQSVARRIRGIMAEQRISQSALATEMGMSQQALSRRTTGRVAFSLDEISHLAGAFQVAESWLLGFSDAASPRPGPDGGLGGEVVRHQGLEPRTR